MFGYVNIYKDELKIKEYNTYRSYYCGLCKTLGKEFSQSVRMGLSYDFAFLSLVLSSIEDSKEEFKKERCIVHPFKKRDILKKNIYLEYNACMSVILTYFKLKDDVDDDKKIKSFIAFVFYKRTLKKAKKKYPEEFEKIKYYLNELNKKEKEKSGDTDEVAHFFAKILEELFSPSFIKCDNVTKEALKNFGYNLGRFIYLADAVNDIKKDIENKNYNPLIYKYGADLKNKDEIINKIRKEQDFTLTLTLDSIAKAFELITFIKNRGLIENIVYLGLRASKDRALKGEE